MPKLRRNTFVLSAVAVCILSSVLAISWAAPKTAPRPGGVALSQSPNSSAALSLEQIADQSLVTPAVRAQAIETYGKLPLSFEANQGQSDQQVKFLSRGSGYTLFLTADEAVLSLKRGDSSSARSGQQLARLKPAAFAAGHDKSAVLRMKLVGANTSAVISGDSEQEGKSNYFIGNDHAQWRTNISNYSKVRYQNAYPGVDLVYYGNQQQLEYDFVVAPGADPKTITLDVSADRALHGKHRSAPLRIAANGDLLVPTDGGEVRFHKPVVYQPNQTGQTADLHAIGGDPSSTLLEARNIIDGRWILRGGNHVGFEVAAYDAAKPLVIDPALSYSTYLGGSANDGAFGVSIDTIGNCYIIGFTTSGNFPTKNPYQRSVAGAADTFITKLNKAGNGLIYSTYLGGTGPDYPFGIAVDASGNAYAMGNTGSNNFPVTAGAFQTVCHSCSSSVPDIFLTKLNAAGSALVYSTYIGGTGDDRAFGIALDKSNDAFIVGWTSSSDFPVTSGAFQTNNNGGGSDAFVAKINSTGSALTYATFLGGSGLDVAFGIAVDGLNDAFVTGYSYSPNFPVSASAFQTSTTVNGAAWVAEVNPSGSLLLYSTYLGGTDGTSAGNSIKVDAGGSAYVTGYTCASDFPTTSGVFQPTFGGDCTSAGGDGFVTKLNSTGTALVFSSYLGGSGDDVGFSIGLDSANNSYITGRSSSTNYPVTPGAFQPTNAGFYDTIFSIVNSTGTALLYSTYLGGSAVDVAFVMAVDKPGNAYIIGRTYSTNFPVTPGVFQGVLKGQTNAIVYKFSPGNQVWPMALTFGNQSVGTTSAALKTTLTNSGTTALSFTGAAIAGSAPTDFAQSTDCGPSIDPGASCAISVTFTPTASGARSASLTITDGSANSPHIVPVSGTGTSSSVSLTPTSLAFPVQVLNTGSAPLPATLTNTGSSDVTISGIVTTAQFSQTNNCGTTLAVGTSCTISVVFTPTKANTQAGTLTITDNAGDPQVVTLSGIGTAMSFSPTSLNFGSQTVNTSSVPQSITLTNAAATPVNITKIFISGARTTSFSQTNDCGTMLNGGASCTITVTFGPKLKGALTANVSVTDTGGASPQNIPLTGSGN